MIAWFLTSLGVKPEIVAGLDHAQLLFARPVFLWWGLVLVILAAVFIHRRQTHNLPHIKPRYLTIMTFCRVAVLALLFLILSGPYLRLVQEASQKPVLSMIIDESASMQLPAGPFTPEESSRIASAAGYDAPANGAPAPAPAPKPVTGPGTVTIAPPLSPDLVKKLASVTRAGLLNDVLKHQADALFKPLAERFDFKVYRVSRGVKVSSLDAAAPTTQPNASDIDDTDLSAGISRAIEDAGNRPMAGILMFTDGRWTVGADPLETVKARASLSTAEGRIAGGVWAVPIGSCKPAPDVAVVDAIAPSRVTLGDRASVDATIDSQGLEGRKVNVQLLGPDGKPVDTQPLTLATGQRQHVQLTYQASVPGPTVLTVAVDEQPEETVKANNKMTSRVDVTGQKMRILILEGSPRWDFRFLDHSIRRDSGVSADVAMETQLRAKAGKAIETLPILANLPQDATGFAAYSVVVLGDVSPDLLPEKYQEQLAKAIEENGVGLIIQAGTAHMPMAFLKGPLARVLPVVRNEEAAKLFDPVNSIEGEAPPFSPFHMSVTANGSIHPAFRLYDSATQNRALWSQMTDFYWASPVKVANPAVTVLATIATASGDRPLIVERYAGRGRVLFVGTDSTYRWRRNIGSQLFYQFWGQALRHVSKNESHSADASWITATPGRVEPGEPVAVELYAVDGSGQPIGDYKVDIDIRQGDAAEYLSLERTNEPGRFRGVWNPKNTGQFRLRYNDTQGHEITAMIDVAASGRELRRPTVDRDGMGALADATGGALLELDQLDRLTTVLKGDATKISKPYESELWDNWLTLSILITLYCVDVAARRLLGLT